MREGTSGFGVTKKDGKITIEYVDFGVSEFGGGDFEKTYYLDKENSKKFALVSHGDIPQPQILLKINKIII